MKQFRILILGLATALCAPTRYTTANAADNKPVENKPTENSPELAVLKQQLDELKSQNESFKLQIQKMTHEHREALQGMGKAFEELKGTKPDATAPSDETDNSTLGTLARGAGVELKDVRWRVAAGLTAEQAVQAAQNQKKADASKTERIKKAKAAEKNK